MIGYKTSKWIAVPHDISLDAIRYVCLSGRLMDGIVSQNKCNQHGDRKSLMHLLLLVRNVRFFKLTCSLGTAVKAPECHLLR